MGMVFFVLAPFRHLRYRSRMSRDGALTLLDLCSPTPAIVCEPCDRRGRYAVTKLLEEHGDAKLTDLLVTLADCPKTRSASSMTGARRFTRGLRVASSARSLSDPRKQALEVIPEARAKVNYRLRSLL